MSSSPQSGDKHSQRLDDELVRDPSDVDSTPDAELFDTPGRDGIVGAADGDPDRTDLRSAIGRYSSLVGFPAQAKALTKAAQSNDAPDEVLAQLATLDPDATYQNTTELWDALGLSSGERF